MSRYLLTTVRRYITDLVDVYDAEPTTRLSIRRCYTTCCCCCRVLVLMMPLSGERRRINNDDSAAAAPFQRADVIIQATPPLTAARCCRPHLISGLSCKDEIDRDAVFGKLFTSIVPLFIKQQNWQQLS